MSNDLTGKYAADTYKGLIQQVDELSSKEGNVYNGEGKIAYILPMVKTSGVVFYGGTEFSIISITIPSDCLSGWFYVTYKCMLLEESSNQPAASMDLFIYKNNSMQSGTPFRQPVVNNFAGNVYAETQQIIEIEPGDVIEGRIRENLMGWNAYNHVLVIQRCHNFNT